MPISVTGAPSLRGVAAPLRALIRTTLAPERRRAGDLTIVLGDDAFLRELNRRYRGKDRATDVLSFAYEQPAGRLVQGDLAISLERMREQARRFRVSRGRELARLVIHGTLHLAGHDHHRVAERRVMRAAETRALRAGRAAIARLDRLLASAD